MRSFSLISALTLSFTLCAGCSSDPATTSSSSSSSSSNGGGEPTPICTMPTTPIPCEDQVVLQMDLKKNLAPGLITDAPDGNGFLSTIDATAGGFNYTDSYIYAKFTETGLVKVDLTDEQSIGSMDWDIAFRRFVIRINSSNSGPSCVSAAALPDGTVYDDPITPPADASFISDEYFSTACELIPDDYGLGPGTFLQHFWEYPKSCVKMTGKVYVVRKADGYTVKLTVDDYYAPMLQEQCNTTGSVPMGTPGATIRMRWAFLP